MCKIEKNELPQTVKLVYNAELNCMVDVNVGFPIPVFT